MAKEVKKLNQLVEVISAVAALDFSKKIEEVKGDGSALDTIAIGLNMLSEELEDSVVSIDDLEDKNAELKDVVLRMNEFKYALDSSSIIVITNLKGNITYVNDKFCEISKYSREELMGQNQRIVNSGYHPKEFWQEMWQTIGKGDVWSEEVKNKAKDGSIYWVNTTIVPFLNEKRKPYKYMAIRQDITERKLSDQRVLNSIISTQEKDREVFSEDLHEGLAQSLAALMMQIGVIELKIKNLSDQELKNSVAYVKSYIQENIETTRVMATSLMPRTMMRYGLEPSLRSFVTSIQKDGSRFIQLDCDIKKVLEKDVEIILYRVIVALIDVVVIHDVTSIVVKISSTKDEVNTLVDIVCCPEFIKESSLESLGMISFKKRVELLSGNMFLHKLRGGKMKLNIRF